MSEISIIGCCVTYTYYALKNILFIRTPAIYDVPRLFSFLCIYRILYRILFSFNGLQQVHSFVNIANKQPILLLILGNVIGNKLTSTYGGSYPEIVSPLLAFSIAPFICVLLLFQSSFNYTNYSHYQLLFITLAK